jgi:hypothetical protein
VLKICNVCQNFEEHGTRPGQQLPLFRCKICMREYHKSYYSENREKLNGRKYLKKSESIREKQEHLRQLKSGPCLDCGETYPHYVMQFDHLRDKEFAISEGVRRFSWTRVLAEIEKCEIVCANCHAERTWARRDIA